MSVSVCGSVCVSVCVCVCVCVFSMGGGFHRLLNIPAGQYNHIQTHGQQKPDKKTSVFSLHNNPPNVTANTLKNNQVK